MSEKEKELQDEKELYEQLNRIKKQNETLRKLKGEGEPYKDLSGDEVITVDTNDKKAMKFWEE